MEKKSRFWVSWVQPTEDHRPLTYPPNESILGWWCTGYDSNENSTLVALVAAENEHEVGEAVAKDWPEWEEWRWIRKVGFDFVLSDRLPISNWMRSRIFEKTI